MPRLTGVWSYGARWSILSSDDTVQASLLGLLPFVAEVGEVENETERNADDDANDHNSGVFRPKCRYQPPTEDTECLGAPDGDETEDSCESNGAEDVSDESHENLLSRNDLHGIYHIYQSLSRLFDLTSYLNRNFPVQYFYREIF